MYILSTIIKLNLMKRNKILFSFTILLSLVIASVIYFSLPNTEYALSLQAEGYTQTAYEYASLPCSSRCESGAECNQYGNPSPGNMWSCWNFQCVQEATNSGGNSCYLDCTTGWGPCGCDISRCETNCKNNISPGESGTYTMLCDNCAQKFTCSCSKPVEVIHPCGDLTFACTHDSQCEDYTNKGVKQVCDANGQNCVDESTTETYDVECAEKADPSQSRCNLTSNACPAGYTAFNEVRNSVGVCGCKKNLPPVTTPPVTTPPVTTPPVTTPPVTTPPVTTPPVTTPPVTTPPVTTPPVTTPPVTTPPVTTPPVTTPPVTTPVVTTPVATTPPVTTPVPGLPKTDDVEEEQSAVQWLVPVFGFGSLIGAVKVAYKFWMFV